MSAEVLKRELRGFEARYGISTGELLEMLREPRAHVDKWRRIPEDADADIVEWEALALLLGEEGGEQ